MDTVGSDVSAGFTLDPVDSHLALWIVVAKFEFIDGTNTKLAFDGRNQWRSLELSTDELETRVSVKENRPILLIPHLERTNLF